MVGVYSDRPPFNVKGQGIDVAPAGPLAQTMGLTLHLLPFAAGEDMGDDLRNMVWKGHFLGLGPADVLLHVPVERPLMAANPQVNILAPYYRERVRVARSLAAAPKMDTLDDLTGNASELESVLGNDPRFAIEPLPLPRMRDGCAGGAVKMSSGDLAEAVQLAMATLGSSGETGRLFAAGRVTWRRP